MFRYYMLIGVEFDSRLLEELKVFVDVEIIILRIDINDVFMIILKENDV